jgi:hypothetical protein
LAIANTVLQYPVEQRLPLVGGLLTVATRQLQHSVLDYIERILGVTYREARNLKCTLFDVRQKAIQ